MTTISTSSNIPLPASRVQSPKYPWRTMEVGESFEVPADVKKNFTAQVATISRRTGKKFATRTVDGVTRVWRIE